MVKVAVVQAGSALFDTPATLKKLEHFAGEAAFRPLVQLPVIADAGLEQHRPERRFGGIDDGRGC